MPKTESKPVRKRRERGSINADDIVAGAFEVARRTSLDQLSMPTLAEHLDVGVTSIYWYFRKKEDLLNAMTDLAAEKVSSRIPVPAPEESWQEVLTTHFRTQRAVHLEDEVLSDLLWIRTSTYSRAATHRIMQLIEAVVARLVDSGFTPLNALRVYNAISVYTRGIVVHDRILRLANAPTLDGRQRRMTDWSDMPLLEGLIDEHPLAGTTEEDFEFGIARLVCGFEVLLKEQDGKPSGAKTPRRSARSAGATSAAVPSKPARKRTPATKSASASAKR